MRFGNWYHGNTESVLSFSISTTVRIIYEAAVQDEARKSQKGTGGNAIENKSGFQVLQRLDSRRSCSNQWTEKQCENALTFPII